MSTAAVWQEEALVHTYLEGVRGAIPLANTQIELMLQIVAALRPQGVTRLLDLGCGDGILGQQLLAQYPSCRGVFVDFSAGMLSAAANRLAPMAERITLCELDYADDSWVTHQSVATSQPIDLIISGFSIHHQPHWRKRELYETIYSLLTPNGVFLNLEHVASPSTILEDTFSERMIDAFYAYHKADDPQTTRAQVAANYVNRPDKEANILLDVETQCDWLRDIGFLHVDCYFKYLELALFGGQKPTGIE